MTYYFIINPKAGKGKAKRIWPKILKQLKQHNISYSYAFTQKPGDATNLARHSDQLKFDAVIGVGGDGTLQEIIASLPKQVPLGVLPCGTGNDFAASLGMPKNPLKALRTLIKAEPRLIDKPFINGRPFINVAGIGFDGAVCKRVHDNPPRGGGYIPYLLTVFATLSSYKNTPIKITIDGRKIEIVSLLITVGNGSYCGGGMKLCPRAVLDDGFFDICIVKDLSKTEILLNLHRIFKGTHIHHRKVIYLRGKNIEIEGKDVPVHADGEPLGHTPISLSLMPKAMCILMPKKKSKTARTKDRYSKPNS